MINRSGYVIHTDLEKVEQRLREEMRSMEGRLNERIDLKVETTEHRMIAVFEQGFGGLRQDLSAQTRVYVYSMLSAVVAVGGLAVAAVRLA